MVDPNHSRGQIPVGPLSETPTQPFDRREWLKAVGTASVVSGVLSADNAATAQGSPERLSVIALENAKPGTTDWQLTYVRTDPTQPMRSTLIEGYCSENSLRAGEALSIYVSARPAATVSIDVYRMGYYAGTGGRHITKMGPFSVEPQPDPPIGTNRVRECNWNPAVTFAIPADWLSGVYLLKLSAVEHRYQSYAIVIVRDDRPADILFQCSDHTWQAYNKWPHQMSLYDADPPQPLQGTTRVSLDRPYAKYPQVVDQPLSLGSGEFLCWEFPLAFWLESRGYDVSYMSNQDTHSDGSGLLRGKTFLSVGHDEYWSLEMYNSVKAAIQNGVNVGFLSGNSVCFVAPLVPSSAGRPNRIFHRGGRYGGLREAERGYMGPFDMEGPNENLLIGARTIDPFNGSGDWTVVKPEHWLFQGTGMRQGEGIPGLVGWEFHGDPAAIPGLEVVAEGLATNAIDRQAHWTATVYPGPKGNIVFNASTIYWGIGLATPPGFAPPYSHWGRPMGPDARVQRITENFLARCGALPAK